MTVRGGASETIAPGAIDTPVIKLSLSRRLLARQELTLIAVLILVGVLATLRNPSFGTSDNLLQVIRAAVVTFIVACPLTLVTIGGGFDFSVGAVFTLGGVSAAYFMTHGIIWPLAILLGIAVGAAIGALNAVTIDRLRVPPIITTLGTFYFMSGVVILFTDGIDIAPLPTQFNALGTGSTLGVPNVIIAGILVGIAYHLVLERTRYGYNVRSLGGNRLAATENGIPVRRLDAWLYIGAGALAAFAGIVYAARTGSGQVSAGGSSVTLTAISAVLIGGTSLFGGIGTITGTALGAILFAEIDNALAVAGIDALYSNMIIGGILVLAVAADSVRRGRMFSLKR
ncbi:ABC transporter permease [Streptosporangium sp. NBC_01756]|uniref:ABC transporter permease n=1 Tax=Streptosporangium sp. NBC_01756 TaxID=2975950 RepID=UPI002DDC0335|nr:ABC transporter permease [Streptosporangium sp. NBC_01756]WSC87866.1 ABC transporter permease [Streptosporangium sp. NBC_01756]